MSIATHEVDSGLGRWTHTAWRPDSTGPLAGLVDQIWYFDGLTMHPRERVFPNGLLEIIVHLGARYRTLDETGFALSPTTCITGIHSQSMVIEAPGPHCRVLGVRLRPAGAYALLGQPLSDLSDRTVDLCELVGRAADELAERCHDASSTIEVLNRAIGWISERIRCSLEWYPIHRAAAWAAEQIANSCGTVPIAVLRTQTGLSHVRMAAIFREQVGVTPKRYARIHRFRHALQLLNENAHSLAQIAARAGYYDQPHMNADFREMAGLTPREILNAARYPNSVSVAESP